MDAEEDEAVGSKEEVLEVGVGGVALETAAGAAASAGDVVEVGAVVASEEVAEEVAVSGAHKHRTPDDLCFAEGSLLPPGCSLANGDEIQQEVVWTQKMERVAFVSRGTSSRWSTCLLPADLQRIVRYIVAINMYLLRFVHGYTHLVPDDHRTTRNPRILTGNTAYAAGIIEEKYGPMACCRSTFQGLHFLFDCPYSNGAFQLHWSSLLQFLRQGHQLPETCL